MKRFIHCALSLFFLLQVSLSFAQMHCIERVELGKPSHCEEMETAHKKASEAKHCDIKCGLVKSSVSLNKNDLGTSFEVNTFPKASLKNYFISQYPQPLLRPPINRPV